ncbi:13698_t:CDS:2 [Acaulospora morrowiae]|uniref:DNA-(apurinic or apyrimidinic site) endonuclease n=1 Tax=Acaulospora morrowiae TaxID=94023 RepID=A0A9N8WMF6_9GLOM|nr:13698_t:CDS:2 [Acaulospora morrowiae]
MRLLTWNVNGLRSLVQYHPWNERKDYKTILDSLNADIICFQETKITLDRLESSMAIIPGYDAYFSFAKGKAAYSGVVTYVKNSSVRPISAEEGISGILDQPPKNMRPADEISTFDSFGCTPEELLNLDSEGRCIILDFKMFVLFNIYCPNNSGPERRPFITQFQKVLQTRVEAMLRAGKQVIVMGDINVTHKEIDHCNPQKSIKESELESFDDHPSRKWFDGLVATNGPLVDVCRRFHPDEKGIYTCWSTVINARPSNYGTRLDYILVSQGLMKWVKSCNVEQTIMGSDHCPVVGEFHETINDNGQILYLKDQLLVDVDGEATGAPPLRLCAKYLSRFSGSQKTLNSFFVKQNTNDQVGRLESVVMEQPKKTTIARRLSNPIAQKSVKVTKSGDRRTKQKVELDKNQTSLMPFFKQSLSKEAPELGTSGFSNYDSLSQLQSEESNQNIVEIMDDCTETCAGSNNLQVISQWNVLFTPRPVPKCKIHGETCKEYRVNKVGPNQGRLFYMCSRPVGNSRNDRCDFFEWAKGNKSSTKRKSPDCDQETSSNKKHNSS